MKRILFLGIAMSIHLIPVSAQFSGKGSGTSDDPYQITNADELFEVRNVLSASYKLMNDIDLTEWIEENNPTQGWSPIGGPGNPFTGSFDGNGHIIQGLFINRPNDSNVGFWGVTQSAIIKNFTLYKPHIIGQIGVGGVAGANTINGSNWTVCTQFYNIKILSPTISGTTYVGGVVGHQYRGARSSDADVEKVSVVNPVIEGDNYVGGIIGRLNSETHQGSISYRYRYNVVVGGIIKGNVRVGGIIGAASAYDEFTYPSIDVSSNYCSSFVKGTKYVGGIAGSISGGYSYYSSSKRNYLFPSLKNNHFAGKLFSNGRAGGIVSYVTPEVDDFYKAEGKIYRKLDLEKNVCSGIVFSNDSTSGIIGEISSFPISTQEDMISIENNVYCGDSLISENKKSLVYRIGECVTGNNYALSTSNLIVYGETYNVEDNNQQGVGYGKKMLTKQTTYEGLDYDFDNNWAIVEGESFPYIITQSIPAKIIEFTSGTNGHISGTAEVENKSHSCNGKIYVIMGDSFNEGVVSDGQWSVDLGEVKEGAVAKVTVMVDGMMPSILTTAIAEKGSTTNPIVDNTPDTDISVLSDVVYINNVEASVGTQLTLSVKMKNAVTAEGFGFDLYLPNGVTVATDEDGFPIVELSTERTTSRKTNSFDAAFQSDGSLRVLAASTNGSTINGNDGEVCLITVNVANDMEEGDYPLLLKNIAISDADAVSHRTEQVKSTLTISAYTPGDANNDGVIDVSDFTATAHYLLGNAPTGFNVKAGDANGDSVVDVADLTAVAHIILYGSVNRPSSVRAYEMNEPQ